MSRLLAAVTLALLLAALLVPAAFAADGDEPVPVDPAPTATPEPNQDPEPTPTPWDGNGEIVIDPTFVIATPEPAGQVRSSTGRPVATPPPTDVATTPAAPAPGLPVLLLLLAGGSSFALAAVRAPAGLRRRA